MNRIFLFLLAITISLSAILVSRTAASLTEEEIKISLEEEMAMMRQGQLDALVHSVKADLLLGNLRGARISLEQSQGNAFTAFRLTSLDGETDASSAFSPDLEKTHFKTSVPVYFGGGKKPWGSVEFYSSREPIRKILGQLSVLQQKNTALVATTIFAAMFVVFLLLFSVSRTLLGTLGEFLRTERLVMKSRGAAWVWSPLLTALDVTAQRAAEARQEMEGLRRERTIAHMIQGIAHDLRNPLSVLEQILRTEGGNLSTRVRGKVESTIGRMHAMVEALRKSDASLLVRLEWQTFSAADFIEQARPFAEAAGSRLGYDQPAEIYARFDLPKVERALMNLVRNAVEVGATFVILSVSNEGSDLLVEVADNGPGVPEHLVGQLFTRGWTHGKEGGTGLGLAYVREVAKGHGGSCLYERREGQSVFSLRLPECVKVPETTQQAPSDEKDQHLTTKPRQESREPLLVVLLDDTSAVVRFQQAARTWDTTLIRWRAEDMLRASLVYTDRSDVLEQLLQTETAIVAAGPEDEPEPTLRRLMKRISAQLELKKEI